MLDVQITRCRNYLFFKIVLWFSSYKHNIFLVIFHSLRADGKISYIRTSCYVTINLTFLVIFDITFREEIL